MSPDDGGDEIFLHSSANVPGGLVSEGRRVAFLVVDSERGPQARDVRLVGGSARRGAPARSTSRPRSGPRRSSDGLARGGQGVVTRYDADRGFGFITPDAGGADLFVHVSVLRDGETLDPGDRVRYQLQSDQGPQADRVELLSSRRRTVCRSSRVGPSRGQARSPCPASASWTTRCEHRFMAA